MKGSSVYKVPNGKLLKISLQEEQGKIAALKISGDFFLHPEEAIEKLEQGLVGVELDEEKLAGQIDSIVSANSIQLFGFSAKDLAKAVVMAVQQE